MAWSEKGNTVPRHGAATVAEECNQYSFRQLVLTQAQLQMKFGPKNSPSKGCQMVPSSGQRSPMARVRTRMPVVFVGHPFGHNFPKKKFRQIFLQLPFSVQYGNTDIQTVHLLSIMKSNITKSDFSIFDLSDWNPNVSLELGLAEGLKRHSQKPYYILLNTLRSGEVPSDIRGLQRLEYTSYDFKRDAGLGDQLMQILAREYWAKKIWRETSGEDKVDKMRVAAMKILAHFRDHQKLTGENLRSLTRGTHFRGEDRDALLEMLTRLKLIRRLKGSKVHVLRKKIYKPH